MNSYDPPVLFRRPSSSFRCSPTRLFSIRTTKLRKIALATLLEEKLRAEARASDLERRVGEMAAAARAAHIEADQLKTDMNNQQSLLVGSARDQPQEETTPARDADAEANGAPRAPATRTPEERDRSKPCATSAPPGEPAASAGDLPDPPNLVTPDTCGGGGGVEGKKEQGEAGMKADANTAGAHAKQRGFTLSPSASRLAEAEDRAASAEKAPLEARDSSRTAAEQAGFFERQLEHARATAGAEAEGNRLAHARVAELERDIDLMGREKEAVRVRAESRLQALRAAFEQEELEAGGKVTRNDLAQRPRKSVYYLCCIHIYVQIPGCSPREQAWVSDLSGTFSRGVYMREKQAEVTAQWHNTKAEEKSVSTCAWGGAVCPYITRQYPLLGIRVSQ